MTDTNNKDTELRSEPKKETFESFYNEIINIIDNKFYDNYGLPKLKQLHDKSIEEVRKEYDVYILSLLKEKDKEIKELRKKINEQDI
jgi:hypothetical protein